MVDAAQTTKDLYNRSLEVMSKIKEDGFSPDGVKRNTKRYSISEAARLVGRSVSTIRESEGSDRLPGPERGLNGRRLGFTLQQLNAMRDEFGTRPYRTDKEDPVILAVSSLKGGVGKTTTAVHLAQYMALQGYRVLLTDADPQASATALFGYIPERDIDDIHDTLYGFLRGHTDSLKSTIRKTYWDGLDLIPSNLYLFKAEVEEEGVRNAETYSQLRDGLDDIKDQYDIIIIDPPPSLGILSLNVISASDALIIPIPAQYPDLASSSSYLKILYQTLESIKQNSMLTAREHKFLKVLITRYVPGPPQNKTTQAHYAQIYEYLYGGYLLKSQFRQTSVVEDAFSLQRTIFEMDNKLLGGSKSSYKRAMNIVESVCSEVELEIRKTWASHGDKLLKDGLI